MECEHSEVRRDVPRWSAGPRPVVRQLRGPRGLRLGRGSRLSRSPPAACSRRAPPPPPHTLRLAPFMSEMEEISYWIHTKRAPCLMNYDNPIKKRNKPHGLEESRSVTEETRSPKKKKKRKLSLLDDESISTERRQNVYFESQKKTRPVEEERRSDTLGSDVDFDIKNTSVREKRKKSKLQKNNRTTLHKKNKVITSTPNTAINLRRSLRHNKGVNHLWNSSYEIFNTSVTNGAHTTDKTNNINSVKPNEKNNQSVMLAGGDQTADNKRNSNIINKSKTPAAQNGQFDDVSDVSGFTANYIRSTKIQSNKTPRKPRSKPNRNLMKESLTAQNESDMVVTVNKAVNTGMPDNILNCSTDSSQNLINLVTNKNNDKSAKVDKSTSLLKFMDTKPKGKDSKLDSRRSKPNLNISFQSQNSGTSRYLTRNKAAASTNIAEATRSANKKNGNKNCIEFNNSDKKENPEEKTSKTRSGRNIGLSVLQRENSVLVVSNSTEPVSSMVSLNVASPNLAQSSKKKRPVRQGRGKKVMGDVQSSRMDSLRDRSGFAACFSESEDDSEPLIQRKYFCA